MIIQHNISAINSYRNLGTNQSQLSKNLEKLSSGYKINRAGDNAAGLAISEQMRAQIAGLNQSVTNARDAIGMIQTAEGALTETHSMLNRMATLFTQAANGTYSDGTTNGSTEKTARENIQVELQKLEDEINRIAKSTSFNGIKPLNQAGTMTFQIGPSSAETILVNTSNMDVESLSVTLNDMCLNVKDANEAIDTVNAAINKVSKFRAELGAAQNRLEHTINSLQVSSENITAAESRIRDTDMADEITAYTKNNILLQAAQSMLTQANATPQGVLSMLQ
ncbi:MAG: flagellin [Lachnospiraceae bacterium]|nr:flagellin [Lachnospiraceae bacterium]